MFNKEIIQSLKNETQTQKFKEIYESVRRSNPYLDKFHQPEDLLKFMHDKTEKDRTMKDDVLRMLLSEYQKPNGEVLGPYILLLLHPALSRLYYEFLHKICTMPSSEPEDLESEIWSACLKTAKRFDLSARSYGIAGAIKNRVKSAVRKWFRSQKIIARQLPIEDAPALTQPENVVGPENLEALINSYVAQGILSPTEALLVVSTRIYKRKLTSIASQSGGESYAALQKRKHRAEAKLKAHIERILKGNV